MHTKILDKLNEAGEYLSQVDELLKIPKENILADFLKLRAAERLFEVLSQIIIDCCTQIVSSLNVETPTTYSSCFMMLGEQKVISTSLAQDLADLAKMRNLVVHQYGKINHNLLLNALNQIVSDFKEYRTSISNWIRETNDP